MSAQILTPDRRIRVFLSSRIQELAEERRALVKLVTQMGHTPIFFEEIPTPHPPQDQYRAYLQQSEIFLGVYGVGYGWVDSSGGMTISGLHDEWNLSEGMPRIVFVKDIDGPRETRLDELLDKIGSSGVSFNRFKSLRELIDRARTAIAQHVTERYLAVDAETFEPGQDYQTQLAKELEIHPIVATRFLADQLQPAVANSQRVFIEGSPGVGKTMALYQLAKANPSTIYLSLRNHSLLSALTYFIERIASFTDKIVRRYSSGSEAMDAFESMLRKTSVTFLIDDVDQAEEIAAELAGLAPGQSRLVFAGRFTPKQFQTSFKLLRCSGFTPQEAEQFVSSALGTGSVFAQTAVERSNGNPLYLRYYIESPAQQPAVSLDDYHSAMWVKLSIQEKELVGIVALSEIPLRFEVLAEVLGHYRSQKISGIGAQDEVQRLGNLLSVQKSRVRIFHPAFRDSVCAKLDAASLSQPIHRALANSFGARGARFLQVVHSVRGGLADKVYDDLLQTAMWANITGRTKAARQLLASAIALGRRKRDWIVTGLGLHQSADMKQHTRHLKSALMSARLAEITLLRSKSQEAALIARASKAVFLIEVGRGDEAETILKEIVEHYSKSGLSHAEAMARVNLAFSYVRRGRMAEVAEQCEKAKTIFEAQGDTWGVAVALLNLQNHYIAMYDRENQVKCIKRLLALSKELDSPRLEMAAYNGMTVYYRREGKLEAAERVCLKAVVLARNAGFWDVEATNTGNLGNVYRDAKRYAKARECYEAVVRIGTEKGSKHHVAFGKEQLASIVTDEGDPTGALKIGDDALVLWREIGDAYREANTEDDQGWRYEELKRHFESGKSYERAAAAWMRAGIFDAAASACGRAIGQYIDSRDYREAARCFEASWSKMAVPEHAAEALRLLQGLVPVEVQVVMLLDVMKIVQSAAPLFSLVTKRWLALDAAAAISAVCKHLRGEFGIKAYLKFLRTLAECCHVANPENAFVALAFGIEQSPKAAVEATEFGELCEIATRTVPDLRYRNDNLVGERWTMILPASKSPAVEIELVDKVPGVRAAVALTIFLLWASRHTIAKQMGRQKWRRIGIQITALPVEECKKRGIEVPAYVSGETPCVLAQLTNPSDTRPTSLPLMICDDFLTYADRNLLPDNRCSVWVFFQVHDGIIQNFTHFTFPRRKARKARGELVNKLFGMHFGKTERPRETKKEDDDDIF